ncbi:MAG TPA: hypothetical protein VF659_09215 [Pyrinomonadaceae bacterium]|jgi:hypothetical protein
MTQENPNGTPRRPFLVNVAGCLSIVIIVLLIIIAVLAASRQSTV